MLFLLIYLTIYGGMNTYLWWRIMRVLPPGSGLRLVCSAWVVMMVLGPILLSRCDRYLGDAMVRRLGWVLFIWMAWCLWFDTAGLACDAWNGVARIVTSLADSALPRLRGKGIVLPVVTPTLTVVIAVLWVALASVLGWFEAERIAVHNVDITTTKLPPATTPIRIALVTDLHVGRAMRPAVIERVLAETKAVNADIVIGGGDLVDGHDRRAVDTMRRFAAITPTLGKYAVVGNHEVYPGLEQSLDMLDDGGFTVLRGRHLDIGPYLRLVGVDDPAATRLSGIPTANEGEVMTAAAAADRFVLLVRHQPTVREEAKRAVDLQLSGHSHGGQIIPFGWFVRCIYPEAAGRLHTFPEGLRLYASRGAGTWGPPFRLGSPPEITVFRILPGALPAAPDLAPGNR